MDTVVLLLAASGTALATGLGAVPVFLLGERTASLRPLLWGFAAGAMGVASVVGLLRPAFDEGSATAVVGGLALGVAFLVASRRLLDARQARARGPRRPGARTSALVFAVLFVHSMPEGLAIGTAYASDTAGLGLFVILAIALHNVPEGTGVAIPMEQAGFSKAKQFWAAVATSVPQPIAAVAAFWLVEQVEGLLPVSFAFAAGAMLALVLWEFTPQAFTGRTWRGATVGALGGGVMMLALGAALDV